IVAKDDGATGTNSDYLLLFDGPDYGGKFAFQTQVGPNPSEVNVATDPAVSPKTDRWYLVFGVHDLVSGKNYIQVDDGPLYYTSITGPVNISATTFQVGNIANNINYFDGAIGIVARFNRMLTPDEKAAIANLIAPSGNGELPGTYNGSPTWSADVPT